MEGMEDRCGWGRDRQVTNTVDPCCLVVQEKESLGWREHSVLPSGTPYRPKPPISWCKSPPDRRSPCLFLFKERGRPISLPGAYLFCFLIFQSSDLTAFYCSAPSSQQQEEPFPLLLDQPPDREELRAAAVTGGPGALLCGALTWTPARWVWSPHSPLQAISGWDWCSHQSCCCGARPCREWPVPTALKPGGWRGLAQVRRKCRGADWVQRTGWGCGAGLAGSSAWWAWGLPLVCSCHVLSTLLGGRSVILAIPLPTTLGAAGKTHGLLTIYVLVLRVPSHCFTSIFPKVRGPSPSAAICLPPCLSVDFPGTCSRYKGGRMGSTGLPFPEMRKAAGTAGSRGSSESLMWPC